LKESAQFRNVLLKDLIQRHHFELTTLLAHYSVGPIIVCDPTDICFTEFREIQSNSLRVERSHTRTHAQTNKQTNTERLSQKPMYVNKVKMSNTLLSN